MSTSKNIFAIAAQNQRNAYLRRIGWNSPKFVVHSGAPYSEIEFEAGGNEFFPKAVHAYYKATKVNEQN